MHAVPLRAKTIDEYAEIVGDAPIEELRRLAGPLRGARVVHVNATPGAGTAR